MAIMLSNATAFWAADLLKAIIQKGRIGNMRPFFLWRGGSALNLVCGQA